MPKLYPEALLFCLLWAVLALAGWSWIGWKAGVPLTLGLFFVIMPASMAILSRTSNFALEAAVRWGILAAAALATFAAAGKLF